MYHGYTKDIPEAEQIENGIEACKKILADNPNNEYWQNMLADFERRKAELFPAPHTSQSSPYIRNSVRWDADIPPHPIDEAYRLETSAKCRECIRGIDVDADEGDEICDCCDGNYENCPNCIEGTGNDTADLLASMRW